MLESAFQSDEPMRFEYRGVSTGLPREFSKYPAAFGGTLDMAATSMRLSIQQSGDLFTGLRR
ncbi:hypothetical protein D7X30_21350 [Corallococcus sp. AB011P]|uniref:hypothetical protein n=1 Tax=Corallococcus sp. AB011P TaxID=2316735 RepID=UPI000EA27195|nr:hypothetical protein [Corallococcus sp. AB011P]RKG56706.1 hypothetical protein D7X30_21350 [Corallococcus sp. AB011P]